MTQIDTAPLTVRVNAFGVRNVVFFCAVILMNYTIMRPSPVDMAFVLALALSVFVPQRVTSNFLVLLLLIAVSITSLYLSSLHLLDDDEIRFQVIIKAYVFVLALIAAYVSSTWNARQFEAFLKVYLFSATLAACLGIVGFFTQLDLLTWDGRARGLLDDPNMYGSLLVPGALIAMYLLRSRRSPLVILALSILVLGVLVSFSRAAIGALLLCGALYLIFLNRRNLLKAGLMLAMGAALTVVLTIIGISVFDEFAEKLASRSTVAQPYDMGEGGRYNRYARAIPLILDNPFGIGVLQVEKYFPEPIHNITLGSFLYYGWASGLAWLSLLFLSARLTWRNFRTGGGALAVLVGLNFFALVLCASLHEGERWRHMWLSLGILWGFKPRNGEEQMPVGQSIGDSGNRHSASRSV